MNFSAERLAKLSGLTRPENTEVLTESTNLNEEEEVSVVEGEEEEIEEGCCGCGAKVRQPGHSVGMMVQDDDQVLFELTEEEDSDLDDEEVEEEMVYETRRLTMESLRDTVLELRDEILAEQEEEKIALQEAPVRKAVRKEIQSILSSMTTNEVTDWMFGSEGRPSQNNKSRATALFGLGFKNSNK